MRSRPGLRLAATLVASVVGLLGTVGAPGAQVAPAQAPPAAAADVTPATAPAGTDPGTAPTEDAKAPAASQPSGEKSAPAGAATGQPKERFEPTEKVRADFDVSFPVDI
jgi:hypothetical protein